MIYCKEENQINGACFLKNKALFVNYRECLLISKASLVKTMVYAFEKEQGQHTICFGMSSL